MIKSQLVYDLLDDYPGLKRSDMDHVVSTIFEEIIGHLELGGRVELRGFGAWAVKRYDARKGRNPKTGETIEVPIRHHPTFKGSKTLQERLSKTLSED